MSVIIDRAALLAVLLRCEQEVETRRQQLSRLNAEAAETARKLSDAREQLRDAEQELASSLHSGAIVRDGVVYYVATVPNGLMQTVVKLERKPIMPDRQEIAS